MAKKLTFHCLVMTAVILWVTTYLQLENVASQGDQEIVFVVEWSPDASKVAVGYNVDLFEVWEVVSQQIIFSIPRRIYATAWSPNGDQLAIAPGVGSVIDILDPTSGTRINSLDIGEDFISLISSMSWSPNGTQIAVATQSGMGMTAEYHLRIWDIATGSYEKYSKPYVATVYWSPDSTRIAVNGEVAEIIEVTTGNTLLTIDNIVRAWSPDSSQVATRLGNIHIWDTATGELIHIFSLGEAGRTNSIAWSPDGTKIASGSVFGRLDVWDATTGDTLFFLPDVQVFSVAWLPNNNELAYLEVTEDEPMIIKVISINSCNQQVSAGDVTELISSIVAANSSGVPSNLCLAPDSTYTLTAPLPEITGNITLIGNGATIRRDPANPNKFRLMNIKNTATVTLENLTLENGYAVGLVGGAIGSNGVVTLRHVHLLNNVSTLDGGAIANYHTLTIENSELRGNRGNRGGAVFNGSGGTLTITESILADNQAMPDNGQPNSNNIGGAIANYGVLTITDSQILNNRATLSTGGGIYTRGNTIVHGSCIHNNADTAVVYTTPDPPVAQDFTNNWWGTVDGPRGSGLTGSGDSIGSNITYLPFITTGCPD